MGRKWKRSSLKVTTGLILSTVLASQGFAHKPIPLYDIKGEDLFNVLNSSNSTIELRDKNGNPVILKKGEPVSFEKTCGQCHENIITDIRASHHGAVGLHDMGWMDNRETYGDDTGAKDFVTNVVLKMRYFRSKSHYGGW